VDYDLGNEELSHLTKAFLGRLLVTCKSDDVASGIALLDSGIYGLVLHDKTSLKILVDAGVSEERLFTENQLSEGTIKVGKRNSKIYDLPLTKSESIADLFIGSVKFTNDLIPTCVVDHNGFLLGLAYSSKESLKQAIKETQGVYYSRSRNEIWVKGLTSGDTQVLTRIEFDCDSDTLKFTVKQLGSGFCHFSTPSCFNSGKYHGLLGLEQTLQSRLKNPVEGSYSNKILSNDDLLEKKIMEEASELCVAKSKDDIINEMADVLYFTMAKLAKNNIELSEVGKVLDARALKVTRRPGLAKEVFHSRKAEKTIAVRSYENYEVQTFTWNELTENKKKQLLQRPIMDVSSATDKVLPIISDVKSRGDDALRELAKKFDGVDLDSVYLQPPYPKEILDKVKPEVRKAIDTAFDNIKKFHEAQLDKSTLEIETMPGVKCSRFSRPIESVGLYVPGGSAVLPSTALMLGIPAMVAGCSDIILATPPQKENLLCPEVLYVAQKVSASGVLLAGGAQAIAALSYGTKSVKKVDKICGPGNQFVTTAKMIVQNDPNALVSIDMPAGPSEVLVIADGTSTPAFVAIDLLSQAEHGPDSQVVLLTANLNAEQLKDIQEEIKKQAELLPRKEIVKKSLAHSYIINFTSIDDAFDFSNLYAPEHLILHLEDAASYVSKVKNAGSIFVGYYTPERSVF
jgi:phosphoribosyl-ATP pyrophosphohydrolase/phosphoribosyl-AMP cyclohydrolase/histidinol dehydrogenase